MVKVDAAVLVSSVIMGRMMLNSFYVLFIKSIYDLIFLRKRHT